MKLIDRERVDGTRVTIGRRVRYSGGRQRILRTYAAEYRAEDGRQVCENLETSNRAQARRRAIEVQQRLESGTELPPEGSVSIVQLVEGYLLAVQAKSVAPKTEWKYRADLDKLKDYCGQTDITQARRFSEDDLYRYRRWLAEQGYADKTVHGAVILAKQLFKWAWRQRLLRDYRLAAVTLPKAKARPQPCFTSAQVDQLIEGAPCDEKLAFALMGYGGLRIGEAVQLRWEDLHAKGSQYTMIHVRRGGSGDTTKDKDERFVPVHPKVASLLGRPRKQIGPVLSEITERNLLKRLKSLCAASGFGNARQFKLHSFRHHFASLCANHHVAYRKALAWLGHSSSEMLDLYYHLHDEDSQQAMMALAGGDETAEDGQQPDSPSEGTLRAQGQSTIENESQVPEIQELTDCLNNMAERPGFEPGNRV